MMNIKNRNSLTLGSQKLLFIGLYILICYLTLSSLWIVTSQIELLRQLSFMSLIEYSMTSFIILLFGAMLLDTIEKENENKK